MVFHKISKGIKDQAIDLLSQGLIPDEICYLLGISLRSLLRWVHNQESYGSTVLPFSYLTGHPCQGHSHPKLPVSLGCTQQPLSTKDGRTPVGCP